MQIIMNAVSNAQKYSPATAAGSIAVVARVDSPAQLLVVEVTDRGPGLRGQTLAQLVTEFGGIDSRNSERRGAIRSSGMGIPICVRIAELNTNTNTNTKYTCDTGQTRNKLMGGSVTLADRTDGTGARFTLSLPLKGAVPATSGCGSRGTDTALSRVQLEMSPHATGPRETMAAAVDRRGQGVRGPVRVLAVDDSPANLRFIVFLLKRLGCTVLTCSDGDEVVAAVSAAAAAGAPIHVCIMDLYMERLNGDAALSALRAAGYSLPVLLCTANATNADAERYLAQGFCGLLGKPFTPEQMRSALTSAGVM
jgi:CheY-like chemotaxis protein